MPLSLLAHLSGFTKYISACDTYDKTAHHCNKTAYESSLTINNKQNPHIINKMPNNYSSDDDDSCCPTCGESGYSGTCYSCSAGTGFANS